MDSLLDKLGIDWRQFIAQLVNFAILLFILYRYLYKPILDMLDKRAKMIAKSIEDAKKAEIGVNEAQKMKEDLVREARVQSKNIVEEAKQIAVKEKEGILAKAKEDSDRIVKAGAAIVKQEKEIVRTQLEKEMGELLTRGLEKIAGKIMSPDEKKKIIEESVDSLKFTA